MAGMIQRAGSSGSSVSVNPVRSAVSLPELWSSNQSAKSPSASAMIALLEARNSLMVTDAVATEGVMSDTKMTKAARYAS